MINKRLEYSEAHFVAQSMGEYLKIEIVAPGYTIDDVKLESKENGILVTGEPKENIGDSRLVTGFSNFFEITNYKKFDKKTIKAFIYNGILTIHLPVREEFRAVNITIAESAPTD